MKLLRDMIGEEIVASVPMLHPVIFQVLKLHGVDDGGIWVESESLTQLMLRQLNQSGSSRTPVFFVPFHEIKFLIQGVEKISISEKAFGL